MRVAPRVDLSEDDRAVLLRWSRGKRTEARLVVRAKIILAAADGRMNKDIAREPGTTPHAVTRWRNRFGEGGLDAITRNQARTSQKPSKQQELAQKIIDTTTQVKPPNATHGSTRTLAKELGLSQSMVHRVRRRPDSSRI